MFRTNKRKNDWMRKIPVTVTVIMSKVPFGKLLDFIYVQSSFLAITRHIDNGIWKKFLQLNILQTWIYIVLIISWVYISWNENLHRCLENCQLHKNFWTSSSKNIVPRHFTYCCILLFLSNISSFKFNLVLNE